MTIEVGARLREERERLGLNQAKMGELGSVGKTTQLKYEKGTSYPDAAYLSEVATVGIDVLYVLTGQRTPRKEKGLSPREQAMLDNFRSLSEGDRAALQRLAHALAQSPEGGVNDASE